jgi:hypothetical protein
VFPDSILNGRKHGVNDIGSQMARKAKELSALEVSRLTVSGHHAVGGVAGLYLYVALQSDGLMEEGAPPSA